MPRMVLRVSLAPLLSHVSPYLSRSPCSCTVTPPASWSPAAAASVSVVAVSVASV